MFSIFYKLFKTVNDTFKVVENKTKLKTFLLLVSLFYLIYVFLLLIKAIEINPYLSPFILDFSNKLQEIGSLIHVIGISSVSLFLYSILSIKKNRIAIQQINKLIKSKSNLKSEEFLLTEQEIQRILKSFSTDAYEIYIFAGNADFLLKDKEQYKEILNFKGTCNILMNERNELNNDIISTFLEKGISIKFYPKNNKNNYLRGRLKITHHNEAACLFNKEAELFKMQEINNKYIVNMLIEEYKEMFVTGKNPEIKNIIFDLAGVFFEGDIQEFLNEVKSITNMKIDNKADNHLCVSEDLNLGKITIKEYVEINIGKQLSDIEADKIKEKWNSTWLLNEGMNKLGYALKSNNYKIALASNCDDENANIYELKNYFDVFDYLFLSNEMVKLKPSKEYFNEILVKLKCNANECLFIDDHRKNIEIASELGFNTILISRSLSKQEKVEYIKKRFKKLSIKHENS